MIISLNEIFFVFDKKISIDKFMNHVITRLSLNYFIDIYHAMFKAN